MKTWVFHSTFPQGYAVILAILARPDTGDVSPDASLNYGAGSSLGVFVARVAIPVIPELGQM